MAHTRERYIISHRNYNLHLSRNELDYIEPLLQIISETFQFLSDKIQHSEEPLSDILNNL